MIRFLIFVFGIVLCFSTGCKKESKNIYDYIPKESKLTKQILNASEKVIYYSDWIIFVLDSASDSEFYDPYLLFYNKRLILKSAAYLPGRIISTGNNEILVDINPVRNKRGSKYTHDLPSDVNIKYVYLSGSERKCNTIINDIQLESNGKIIKAIVKKSEYEYEGYNVEDGYYETENWKITDTLVFNLSDLEFNIHGKLPTISTYSIANNGHLVADEMIVASKEMLQRASDELWLSLNGLPH